MLLEFSEGVRHLGFECIDCGYSTYELAKMREHQENHKQYHTLWQELKRNLTKMKRGK